MVLTVQSPQPKNPAHRVAADGRPAAPARGHRALAFGLAVLAAGMTTTALLGPLGWELLRYRTSDLALSQITGGDLAVLVVAVPVCVGVAVLAHRDHRAAPVLALAPAGYAIYLYSQLIMGNEYTRLPGNIERYFPLLLGVVLVAAWVAVLAWRATAAVRLPDTSRRYDRVVGVVLLVLAAYVLLGIHLGSYLDAISARPTDPQYLGAPTAFWAVKLWDLAAVVPAATAVGLGMLRHRDWARRPMYALLGGYLLLGCSVSGMAWTMLLRGDAGGSLVQALATSLAVVVMAASARQLYGPLFRPAPDAAHDAAVTRSRLRS